MRERVYRAKYLDIQTSIRTHRNTQHLPDYKTPTLAANDVHFEGGMIEPGLDVEPQEASRDGVLQVGDLHRVAVLVPTQQLRGENIIIKRGLRTGLFLMCLELQKLQIVVVLQHVIRNYFGSISDSRVSHAMINIFLNLLLNFCQK